MPFDPTKPANNSLISSAELRSQLTGLKALIDLKPDLSTVTASCAGPVDSVTPLALTVSNPPTQAQLQAVVNKLNELLSWLKREQ
jgi:hypothetical protein